METPQEQTPEQLQQEANKIARKSLAWIMNWLKDSKFLLEEREDLIKAYKSIELITAEPDKDQTPEAAHEKNKVIRYGLAWVHYKLGITPIKQKNLDDAMIARGVLYEVCMDLQKKIEEVEPPAPKAKEEAPAGPYVIDAGTIKIPEVTQ